MWLYAFQMTQLQYLQKLILQSWPNLNLGNMSNDAILKHFKCWGELWKQYYTKR